MRDKLVVLTGAGISAESGIKTFRDAGGLWEGHDIMDVASPIGWNKNPALVLDFYNQRRRQLSEVMPNLAHHKLVELEARFHTTIITQNVDNLHERAGSSDIIHLHGELTKSRGCYDVQTLYDCQGDIQMGDLAADGSQMRPHIVWFGESVPMIEKAVEIISEASILLIIGTSLQVYPAAGLIAYAPLGIPIYYIDPNPQLSYELAQLKSLTLIAKSATEGIVEFCEGYVF